MESNLRICMAIATFHPIVGGAEKQAFAQCRHLRERGYEAAVVTFRHDRQWPRCETVEGVPVVRIAGALLGGRDKLPRILQRLLYALALAVMGWVLWRCRRHYDVLHVHQCTMLVLPAALACWLAHKPMLVVVHSAGMGKIAQAHSAGDQKGTPLQLVAGPLAGGHNGATPQWLQVAALPKAGGDLANLECLGTPGMRFTHALLQHVHAVPVVISSRMQSYLAHYDFTLPGTQLIPNGVDIVRFHPRTGVMNHAPTTDERARTVLCVSRLSYEKGIDVLLQAWHLVQQLAPELRAHLVVVGGGPLEAQLQRMAQALHIADSVVFAGVCSNIPEQLHRGSLAVLPSRWEGMPIAVLEAMACGLPCVATRVSGSEDIIQHAINGLLVEPEDYQSLARAIVRLLGDPALLEQYGRAARVTIEQRYTLEHVTDAYLELYQHIARRSRPVGGKEI